MSNKEYELLNQHGLLSVTNLTGSGLSRCNKLVVGRGRLNTKEPRPAVWQLARRVRRIRRPDCSRTSGDPPAVTTQHATPSNAPTTMESFDSPWIRSSRR